MAGVGEVPAGGAEAVQHVGPDRLNNVDRIELGAEPRRQLPPYDFAQVWLVGQKDLLRGGLIALAELFQKRLEGIGRVHGSFSDRADYDDPLLSGGNQVPFLLSPPEASASVGWATLRC